MSVNPVKTVAACAILLAIMTATSCINDRYEISDDNLDLNVTIFQDGLTLPLGSTAKIRVDSLISQLGFSDEYSQFLTLGDDGAYSLSFVSDNPIDFSKSLKTLKGFNVKRTDVSKTLDFHFPAQMSYVNVGEVNMPTFTSTLEHSVEFAPLKTLKWPEHLTYVDKLILDDVYMSVSMMPDSDFPDLGDGSVLSVKAEAVLPDFLVLDDPRFKDGKLSFSGTFEKQPSGELEFIISPIKVEAIDVKRGASDFAGLSGSIGIVCNITVSDAKLKLDQLFGGKTHSMDLKIGFGTVRNGVAQNNVEIREISGKVDYRLETREYIVELSDLSGFISGENLSAKIDLASFFVALGFNTNLSIPVSADITVLPYYGKEVGQPDTKRATIVSSEPSDQQKHSEVKLDFASLLYQDDSKTKFLDSLRLSIAAFTEPEQMCVYEPSKEYSLSIDYAAGVPMAFGKDFEIVYKDKIKDLPEAIGTIIGYSRGLGLVGEVENSLPFNLSLVARLCDSEGNVVGESSTDGPLIKGCNVSGKPVTTKLNLMISTFDGVSGSDVASIELELKLDTETTAGVPLKEDSYIKVNSLCARIPKGISLDLSELTTENEDKEQEGNN